MHAYAHTRRSTRDLWRCVAWLRNRFVSSIIARPRVGSRTTFEKRRSDLWTANKGERVATRSILPRHGSYSSRARISDALFSRRYTRSRRKWMFLWNKFLSFNHGWVLSWFISRDSEGYRTKIRSWRYIFQHRTCRINDNTFENLLNLIRSSVYRKNVDALIIVVIMRHVWNAKLASVHKMKLITAKSWNNKRHQHATLLIKQSLYCCVNRKVPTEFNRLKRDNALCVITMLNGVKKKNSGNLRR